VLQVVLQEHVSSIYWLFLVDDDDEVKNLSVIYCLGLQGAFQRMNPNMLWFTVQTRESLCLEMQGSNHVFTCGNIGEPVLGRASDRSISSNERSLVRCAPF
jgi:hypothetical protein